MQQTIKSGARGHANHGWLDSRHSFSFADYYNPEAMGVSHLRVINEDRVAPGAGFSTHGHRDMEIISYVLSGELKHQDSMGDGSVIRPGDVQLMSAGRGVTHSEHNASQTEPVHFLQIWILPNVRGGPPGYAQEHFTEAQRRGQLRAVVTPDGRDGSLTIKQDMTLYASLIEAGDTINFQPQSGRLRWVHVARGELLLNQTIYEAGDGIYVSPQSELRLTTSKRAEFLLFDLQAVQP